MDQLVARLTDLGYEIFGVFLPGAIGTLFLVAWWWALGPLPPLWTFEAIPQLTFPLVFHWMQSLDSALGIGIGVPLLIASYFVGHFLLWVSRFGGPLPDGQKGKLVWRTLTFRIQRPDMPYDSKLEPLFTKISELLTRQTTIPMTWRQIYPIAKSVLTEERKFSLLSTYQNKYTLHRSLALASVVLTWLSTIGLIAAAASFCASPTTPPFGSLTFCCVLSSLLAVGFTSSYRFYWLMWGNTVVSELFTHLFIGKQTNAR